MLGQRLVKAITESTNIDSTSGTEHTESVEPETFPADIAP